MLWVDSTTDGGSLVGEAGEGRGWEKRRAKEEGGRADRRKVRKGLLHYSNIPLMTSPSVSHLLVSPRPFLLTAPPCFVSVPAPAFPHVEHAGSGETRPSELQRVSLGTPTVK